MKDFIEGHGCIEIYNPHTGEILDSSDNQNVILDQGILGIIDSAQPGVTQWVAWDKWLIQVGTGYRNPASARHLTGLDTPVWTSAPGNTKYEKSGGTFTVTAEIPADQANGALTEACLFSNRAFNRLMFKSPPTLPMSGSSATYEYRVVNQVGTGAFRRYSPPSTIRSVQTMETGANLLEWRQNYTGLVDRYHVFRKGPLDTEWKLLIVTTNTFFVDAGFIASQAVAPYTEDATITAPSLEPIGFSKEPQPKARIKDADNAARIKITLAFNL